MSATSVAEPIRPRPVLPAFGPASIVAALGILLAASALRLSHIGTGLPYAVGVDEPDIMNRVAAMMKTGDFNPHFFSWPSVTFYLNLAVSCLVFVGGSMRGLWSNLNQVGAPELYFGARVFTALLGTATVALTMAAARRWGTASALVAGALMAVVPSHVRESHYVVADVPTAFFTTLTLLLSLRALEQYTTRRVLWAAVTAGLAASCQYHGSLAIIMPLIVVWAKGGGMAALLNRTIAVAGVALAAFVAGTPYAVIDLPAFLNDYARPASTFAARAVVESGWTIYPKQILGSLAWPAVVAALTGVVLALGRAVSGPGRAGAAALVGFAALYFAVMARSHPMYGRHLLPLYPCLCVFCGLTASAAIGWLRRRHIVGWQAAVPAGVLAVVLLALPAASAVGFARQLGRTSTVDLAFGWFVEHVPKGSKVAVEAGSLQLPDDYSVVGTPSLLQRTYDDYVADGVTYFLAASPDFQSSLSDPAGHREAFMAYRIFFSRASIVASFDPLPDLPGPHIRIYQVVR